MTDNNLTVKVIEKLTELDYQLINLLGVEIVDVSFGRCVCRLTVRDDLVNSGNVCQGGIIFTLADFSLAYASMTGNQSGATLSANIHFTNPAPLGDVLTSTAEVSHDSGGRTVTVKVEVKNQHGLLIAESQAVWSRAKQSIIKIGDA
ncbi:MAG: PaaI family thioesterase [Chloroflexota bacterium]